MTTVKKLKEWLEQFPEDTIVDFTSTRNNSISFKTVDIDNCDDDNGWEFTDFRNNKFVKSDADHYGKCYLTIGE